MTQENWREHLIEVASDALTVAGFPCDDPEPVIDLLLTIADEMTKHGRTLEEAAVIFGATTRILKRWAKQEQSTPEANLIH